MYTLGSLKIVVNDVNSHKALMDYLDDRLLQAYRGLEQASDLQKVGHFQGQVALLKEMKKLRDIVNGASP